MLDLQVDFVMMFAAVVVGELSFVPWHVEPNLNCALERVVSLTMVVAVVILPYHFPMDRNEDDAIDVLDRDRVAIVIA